MRVDGAVGSSRLAEARRRKRGLAELLSDWQAKHGKITPAELAKARAELGYTVEPIASPSGDRRHQRRPRAAR